MGWVFRSAYESFDQYREMWDEINRTQGNHILLDSIFVRPLIRYFASQEALLGISEDPRNPGMVLVDKIKKGLWQTFQPSQSPLGLILFGNKDNVLGQIRALMHSLPGYALGFAVLQQDPDVSVFRDLNRSQMIEILEYTKTARVTLTGTFEDYWKRRGRDLVDNLARRCRHLTSKGIQFELVVDRHPGRVAECIQEYGTLEGIGWKSRQGTAVTADNRQGLFYREMLEDFCRDGEGVMYRLLFDGKTVASQLGLERDGMLILLKMAFDENFKDFSPGFLIQRMIFKTLFSEGKINVVEFYGPVRDGWTTKWTDEIRRMYHVNFYRHGWVVVARRFLKACSRLLRSEAKE
jgi:hypothetical protein